MTPITDPAVCGELAGLKRELAWLQREIDAGSEDMVWLLGLQERLRERIRAYEAEVRPK